MTVTFKNSPQGLAFGVGLLITLFVGTTIASVVLVGTLAAVLLLVLGSRPGLADLLALARGAFWPALAVFVFLAVGASLIRYGTRRIFAEAEVWTFDKTRRVFTISTCYLDRRTLRRWLTPKQHCTLPAAGAVSFRALSYGSTINVPTIPASV